LISNEFEFYANQSWGYYPVNAIGGKGSSGFTTTSPGIIENDTEHSTDVYKKYDISTLSNLTSLLQFTQNIQNFPGTYNVNSNNCTTIAVAAAESAGISVPKTFRSETITWGIFFFHFQGYNPGDLGEDLVTNGGVRGQFSL
jgi:hypothetical protein